MLPSLIFFSKACPAHRPTKNSLQTRKRNVTTHGTAKTRGGKLSFATYYALCSKAKSMARFAFEKKHIAICLTFRCGFLKSADYYSGASIEESPWEPVLLPIFCSFYEILFACWFLGRTSFFSIQSKFSAFRLSYQKWTETFWWLELPRGWDMNSPG
jgi:hypothetical protein